MDTRPEIKCKNWSYSIDAIWDLSNGDIIDYDKDIHGESIMIGHTFVGDKFTAQVKKINIK
ncbi:MAG: hypothetical protein ACRDD7_12595 [Peptostreptococcaceae bacterium]